MGRGTGCCYRAGMSSWAGSDLHLVLRGPGEPEYPRGQGWDHRGGQLPRGGKRTWQNGALKRPPSVPIKHWGSLETEPYWHLSWQTGVTYPSTRLPKGRKSKYKNSLPASLSSQGRIYRHGNRPSGAGWPGASMVTTSGWRAS